MASLGSGVLLVDENIEGGPSNGSWAFDGTSWVQLSVTNPTPIREYGAMAPLGGDVILFGGDPGGLDMQLQDTWLFNGASWAQIATSVEPPARQDAMMATLGSKVVLFGGVVSGDAGGSLFQDTWTFDGTTWTEVTVPNPPTPRFVAAMAPLGDKIVLFGGGGDQGDLQDTWTFDGTSWTQLSIATPPPARANAAMAPLGNKLVLFGGSYGPTALRLQDTWTFDGTNWTQLTTPVQPPACAGASMATLFCAGGQCPTGDGGDAGVDGGEQ
jgi:N-acetylneuraminic acid mutarotase